MDNRDDEEAEAMRNMPDTPAQHLRAVEPSSFDPEIAAAKEFLERLNINDGEGSEETLTHLAVFWRRHLSYDMETRCFYMSDQVMTPSDVADIVWSHKLGQVRLFRIGIARMVQAYQKVELAKTKGRLLEPVDRAKASTELDKFVSLLAFEDSEPDRLAYYAFAFRQLIWQVKRRLRGLDCHASETMPVLVGPQGVGKSSLVRKFARPLDYLYKPNGTFRLFRDAFSAGEMYRHYLILFDEMEGHAKTDIAAIKQHITAPTVGARKMYSQDVEVWPRNASFIGTSNRSLPDIIKDQTGTRRFVEIKTREKPFDDEFRKRLADIDFRLLWGCETGEDERYPMGDCPLESRRRFQNEARNISMAEEWAEEWLTPALSEKLKAGAAYDHFLKWCDEQRLRPGTRRGFMRQMTALFGDKKGRSTGNVTVFHNLIIRANSLYDQD